MKLYICFGPPFTVIYTIWIFTPLFLILNDQWNISNWIFDLSSLWCSLLFSEHQSRNTSVHLLYSGILMTLNYYIIMANAYEENIRIFVTHWQAPQPPLLLYLNKDWQWSSIPSQRIQHSPVQSSQALQTNQCGIPHIHILDYYAEVDIGECWILSEGILCH